MKIGLVLEGGASRTLFTAGVLDVLMDNDIKANYIIGTSAGISSGVSYASGQRGRNYQVYTTYMPDKRYMGLRYFFDKNNKSYYNMKFVFDDIPNIYCKYDFDALGRFDGEVLAAVTNYETGKPEYIAVTADDTAFDTLRATCALPIMFPPIEINGNKYMDGGIADSIPFEYAIQNGCEKNIVILTRHREYRKKKSKSIKLLRKIYKYSDDFANALENRYANYNACLERLFEAEKSGKAFVIAPHEPLNYNRTESDKEKLIEMYNIGFDTANSVINDLKKYLTE